MEQEAPGRRTGIVFGAASPIFLSLVPIFVTLGYEGGAGLIPLLLARTGIAAAAAWVLVLIGIRRGRGRGYRMDRELFLASVSGVVLNPLAGYVAIEELGPALYAACYFIHVPVLAILVPRREGRSPGIMPVVGALGCAAGVALVSGLPGSSGGFTAVGMIAAALNVACFIVMALILHSRSTDFDATRFNAEGMGLATIVLLAIYLVGFSGESISAHTWQTSAAIALAAWLPGRLLWTAAVQRIGARTAALLASLQPMLVALLGAAVLDESLTLSQWLGILTICTSVAWVQARGAEAVEDEI